MHSRPYDSVPPSRTVGLGMAALLLASSLAAAAQAPGPQAASPGKRKPTEVRAITEDEVQHQLQGKFLYLRGGYFDNDLRFDEQGRLNGNPPRVSYTLSLVQIEKVHLTKHRLELRGIRYGIHFLGAGPTEDPLAASDRVRITPKKKVLKISIERAEVVKPKKPKHSKEDARSLASAASGHGQGAQQTPAPAGQLPEDGGILMTQQRANELLRNAIDNVFAPRRLDERMVASLPDFWRVFYQEEAARTVFKPSDAAAVLQNAVDRKARLLTNFPAPSSDLAQAAGVAGVAQFHVVVGRDGKPEEIAVDRPIGFGLDENAVESIRKATFQPAMKDGKPVPVLLDLMVEFRIFSKRTAPGADAEPDSARVSEPEAPSLPGPYTANQPITKQQ